MKDPIITYRGASAYLSELDNSRKDQLQQQQGTRLVQYRGHQAQVRIHPEHVKQTRTITYRGVTAEMEV